MDANQKLDMGILKGAGLASCDNDDPPSVVCAELFDLGLMGIEIPEKYGGTGSSFTGACIVVEELAKIDPAISVIVDIQNTLINKIFYTYASDELQSKYASLRSLWIGLRRHNIDAIVGTYRSSLRARWPRSAYRNRGRAAMRSRCAPRRRSVVRST